MGSSFLTTINVLLGLYCVVIFLKMAIQFGLPTHPGRFTMYLVTLCAAVFFSLKGLAGLGWLAPVYFLKWRTLPIVAGSMALLLQVISTLGQLSLLQQKIFSRLPLIASLLVFAFFPSKADFFFILCLSSGTIFLTVSVGKVRYQKRMFFKMVLFLALFGLFTLPNNYWTYVAGELFLFPALFYFSIFQKTFGISALIEQHQIESPGVAP